MTGPEFTDMFGEEERANDYELGTIYAHTKIWLEDNTPLFVEPIDDISGTYDDLPIAQHNPYYSFDIPGSILKSVVPQASKYFDDDDTFCLTYVIPHYTTLSSGGFDDDEVAYRYENPVCSFEIRKANDPIYDVSITIEAIYAEEDAEDTWQVRRDTDSNLEVHEEINENPYDKPFIDAEQIENGTNISRMTKQEYDLFIAIVNKLDEIKAMIPEPPLYVPEDPR